MKTIFTFLGVSALCLTACDVTHPVAVVGPGETVFRGTATATVLEGGWFQVSNGGVNCTGRYAQTSDLEQVTFPVRCSNGLTGIGTAKYQSGRAGGGEIVMADGSRWKFIFGQAALLI